MAIPLQKLAAESILFYKDCTPNLAAGEVITGTPVMSFLPALTGMDALTIGAPVVNTTATTYPDGLIGSIGCVIQARISGGSTETALNGRTYTVIASFATSFGNTLMARMLLTVIPPQQF
jgi:hypothetical protein